ncbi:MAG: hypothetical protein RMA76_35450 [Deltaproteobacteria bacterium]|jgi:hypothetical protein
MTDVRRTRAPAAPPSLPPQSKEVPTKPPPLDRSEVAAPNRIAEAMKVEPAALSLAPTPELKALSKAFKSAVKDGLDPEELTSLRARADTIDDVVQRDLAHSALDKIEAQSKGGLTDAHRAMLGDDLIDGYTERAVAILGHPALEQLAKDPKWKRPHDELAMFLVRYANDPVYLATIERHVTASGGITNAHQMAVGEDHALHRVDAYFGQCNETQARTREIFEGLDERLGGTTLKGFDVTERSTVLLAYGLMGDGPGDHHFLYGLEVPGAGPLYVDPWVDQRADAASIKTPEAYKKSRDKWDAFHVYTEGRR